MSNKYEIAKDKADEIDCQIINVLQSKKNFRIEAGAGSGKTYSLNKVIDWLQDNCWNELQTKRQKVACITYTNTGVNVIASRLRADSFIKPMTIHSFAWELIKQFKNELKYTIIKNNKIPEGADKESFEEVQYTLGVRYIENKVLYLYHDDVIFLFAKFLDNIKFRRLLTLQYPIILIDEYQDSLKIIIDQFLNWYIEKGEGPQFGFFGDAWQTIYDKNSCGVIDSPNIIVIGKESNFRSEQVIVDALNNIRPELPQISATDNNDGFIHVVICNDYKGKRQTGYYKDELPNEIITERVNKLQKILNERYGWSSNEDHITLMITHKMLAKQQNYEKLLVLLDERLKDGEDAYLKFFSKTIEPLYAALEKKQMTQLFEVLGSNRYPIEYKRQKNRWNELKAQLEIARKNTVGDIMDVLYNNLDLHIPISPKVQEGHKKFLENQNTKYEKGTIGEYYKISYVEVLNAIAYLNLDTEYSTDHGVKGKEYENVLWVIGRGWNNYQFDKYMGIDPSTLSGKDYDAYIRNRNLFYVCCSRAKKRLVLFITIVVEEEFLKYLQRVFGKENIYLYEEYMQN